MFEFEPESRARKKKPSRRQDKDTLMSKRREERRKIRQKFRSEMKERRKKYPPGGRRKCKC